MIGNIADNAEGHRLVIGLKPALNARECFEIAIIVQQGHFTLDGNARHQAVVRAAWSDAVLTAARVEFAGRLVALNGMRGQQEGQSAEILPQLGKACHGSSPLQDLLIDNRRQGCLIDAQELPEGLCLARAPPS